MMIYCERCRVSEEKVRLFDAIYEGQMTFLCERCSIIENAPIVKRADSNQLKTIEKTTKPHGRFQTTSSTMQPAIKKDTFFREDRLRELDKNPKQELPDKNRLNLIQNFHWEIMRIRRRRGYSHRQLADAIHESALALEMIEKGKLPENSENLIIKLEQFFQINLRKPSLMSRPVKQTFNKPVLLDKDGKMLDTIPEDTFEIESEEEGKNEAPLTLAPDQDLDLKSVKNKTVTIGDLKSVHKKRVEATRQEQIEEQKKIEERKKILEAHRERDRLKIDERRKQQQERQSNISTQHAQDLKKKLIEQHQQEKQKLREKESEDIDKRLGGMELLDE
ncbi:MAG: hypothetical protein RL557_48 [archaeon]